MSILDVPRTYRDVLPALAKTGVIPTELAEALSGLAGLRNLLVHDNKDIDHTILWSLIDHRLDDLRQVQHALVRSYDYLSRLFSDS